MKGEVTNEIYIERVCPECGEEIGLLERDLKRLEEETLIIKCPKCGKGKLTYKRVG